MRICLLICAYVIDYLVFLFMCLCIASSYVVCVHAGGLDDIFHLPFYLCAYVIDYLCCARMSDYFVFLFCVYVSPYLCAYVIDYLIPLFVCVCYLCAYVIDYFVSLFLCVCRWPGLYISRGRMWSI